MSAFGMKNGSKAYMSQRLAEIWVAMHPCVPGATASSAIPAADAPPAARRGGTGGRGRSMPASEQASARQKAEKKEEEEMRELGAAAACLAAHPIMDRILMCETVAIDEVAQVAGPGQLPLIRQALTPRHARPSPQVLSVGGAPLSNRLLAHLLDHQACLPLSAPTCPRHCGSGVARRRASPTYCRPSIRRPRLAGKAHVGSCRPRGSRNCRARTCVNVRPAAGVARSSDRCAWVRRTCAYRRSVFTAFVQTGGSVFSHVAAYQELGPMHRSIDRLL